MPITRAYLSNGRPSGRLYAWEGGLAALLVMASVLGAPSCLAAPHEADGAAAGRAASASVDLGIGQALGVLLARAVGVETQRLDLATQLEQAGLARLDFLPQGSVSSQGERSRASGAVGYTQSIGADLISTLKLRTGTVLSTSIGSSVIKSPGSAALLGGSAPTTRTVTQSIGLSQPLLRGAGTAVATLNERQADLAADGARLSFRQGITDLVQGAVLAYFSLEQARRNVALARDTQARAAQVRTVNEALLAAGRIARTALLQNDVDQAQAEFVLEQALQTEKVAQRTLLRSLGLYEYDPDRTTVTLRDSFVTRLADGEVDEESLVRDAVTQRVDLQQARDSLASAQLALSAAEDALNNQLDVYVKVDRQRIASTETGAITNRAIGFSFSMLLDKSTLRAGVNAARASVKRAELNLGETQRIVESSVRDAVKAIEFSRRQLRMAERTAALAAQRMTDEVLKAQAGRSSAIELTQVQDAVRDAREQEVQAQYAVFTARLELQRLSGRLLDAWGVASEVQSLMSAYR